MHELRLPQEPQTGVSSTITLVAIPDPMDEEDANLEGCSALGAAVGVGPEGGCFGSSFKALGETLSLMFDGCGFSASKLFNQAEKVSKSCCVSGSSSAQFSFSSSKDSADDKGIRVAM